MTSPQTVMDTEAHQSSRSEDVEVETVLTGGCRLNVTGLDTAGTEDREAERGINRSFIILLRIHLNGSHGNGG